MPSSKQLVLIGLALLVAILAFVMRLIVGIAEPLWIDELHTAWCIDDTIGAVSRRAAQGNQTPLYFWMEWLVCNQFGLTEFWLRLPSMVCSSLTAVVASLLVWSFNRSLITATTTGLLIAIDPLFIFYGSEARPYALLHLLSAVQVFVFIHEVRLHRQPATSSSRRHFNPWLAILTGSLLLTHLTAVSLIVAELVFLLAFCRWFPAKRAAVSIGVGCLALIPMAWLAQDVFSKRQDWQTVSDSSRLFQQLWPVLVVYAVTPVVICLPGWWRQHFQPAADRPTAIRLMRWLALMLAWGLTPVVLLWLADLSGFAPAAMNRYAQVGALAWPVLCGVLLATIGSRSYRTVASVLILVAAIGSSGIWPSLLNDGTPGHYRDENWAAAVNLINSEASEGTVFLFSNLIEDHQALPRAGSGPSGNKPVDPLPYLSFPVTGIHKIKPGIAVIPRPTLQAGRFTRHDLAAVREENEAWLLIRGQPGLVNAITREFENTLQLGANQSFQIDVRELPGSRIYVVKISIVQNINDRSLSE